MRSVTTRIGTILAILLFVPSPADSRDKPVERRSTIDRVAMYSFSNTSTDIKLPISGISTGTGMALSSVSPGLVIGHTWYDQQRNGSMRRMTRWGQHTEIEIDSVEITPGCTPANPCTTSTDYFISHFGWMYLDGTTYDSSGYAYQAWIDPSDDVGSLRFLQDTRVQPDDDRGGYVVLDVTNDNRAIIGGHNKRGDTITYPNDISQPHIFWDRLPSAGFYRNSKVPDSIAGFFGGGWSPGSSVLWPAMAYQEGDGTAGFSDTVTHILATQSGIGSTGLYYIRKVGGSIDGSGGAWIYPPYIVDTTFVNSHDLFASKISGKVVMAWTAPRPDPGDCDTCSSNTGNYSVGNSQIDNDLYYQISQDQGASWDNRVNLTKRVHPDSTTEPSFWPYIDLSVMLDNDDDEAHIVWSARYYESGSHFFGLACKLFHWSENIGFNVGSDGKQRGIARQVHNAVWDQTTCNGGAWQMNLSKMTVSQCNGKHYVIWEQFNDTPGGISDDCAERAFTGSGSGAANGELFLAVSGDGGISWDGARNLTKSYTPHCDPNMGSRCESDVYASMSPHGYTYVGDLPANLVIPDGGSDVGSYLDVQFVSDPDPGSISKGEGTWQQADIKWFRIPCVEPTPLFNSQLDFYPYRIDFPTTTNHGVQTDFNLVLTNSGPVPITYSTNVIETGGPSGWLTVSGLTGTIPTGLQGYDTGSIHVNTGGIVNSPGTIVALTGGLEFVSNLTSSPDTLLVNCWVADTVVAPSLDTISSYVFSLVVSNNGNMGNSGDGGVNMDFVGPDSLGPDCDSTNNVVLYDGSPFVMWVDGTDTVANWSIFSDGWLSDRGFRPRVGKHKFESYLYESYSTGVFSTNDSSIFLEKTWYSPRNYGTNDQGFFVQCVKLWSADGLGKNNITVGEAIDWDVPSDSLIDNSSGFVFAGGGSHVLNLIYQQGVNYPDGDTTECQDNSRRVAGVAPRGTWVNGSLLNSGNIVNGMTIDNPTFTYPMGTFVPQQLYEKIDVTSGYELYTSTNPDSEFVDLTTIVTNLHQYNLGATDTLKMYYVMASSIDTDPAVGAGSEFRNWIDAGIAFMDARVCYADWMYPTHIAYQATSVVVAGDMSGGTSPSGATATYNAGTNATTITGSSPIEYISTEGMCVTSVNGGATAFHRVSWLSASTPVNAAGSDTIVFRHDGEGVGAAKTATFSWYVSNDQSQAGSLQGAAFTDPSINPNIDAFSTFIQGTTSLSNYTGWSPEVPSGNDVGVPRTVNETIVDRTDIGPEWLYVKTTTDGGGGPYADGTQIDGFLVYQSFCTSPGNFNGVGGVDIADLTFLVAYLFKGGPPPPPPPPPYGDADCDDFEVVSWRDMCFLRLSFYGSPPLSCATRPALQQVAVVEASTFLFAEEAFVPPASMLPPGQTTFTIHVNLQTNHTIQAGSFPFSIRLDGGIPQIDTVITPASCIGGTTCGEWKLTDDANGIVWSGVWKTLEPGTHEIAAVEIDILPLVEDYRTITIALDSLPPFQNSRAAFAPWVTAPGFDPDVGVWVPRIGGELPCVGEIRGNIDCDVADDIDIADLTFMVNFMFKNGIPLLCPDEADVNGDLSTDIADLTYLVAYMFKSGPPPAPCPTE